MTGFAPSHAAPEAGLDARTEPDPDAAVASRLDPHLPVEVIDRRGDWAQVRCSNGWEAWVDGRQLVGAPAPAAAPAPTATARLDPLLVVGAALVVVAAFLPWLVAGAVDVDAWDVPLVYLFLGEPRDGVGVGWVLALAGVLAAVPLALRRSIVPLELAVPGIALGIGGLAFIRVQRSELGLDPGAGIAVAIVGGLLALAAHVRSVR